jgi:hypothetical protein
MNVVLCYKSEFGKRQFILKNNRGLPFLVAFANLRKANVSFVMSVRPSVRMEKLGSQCKELYETLSCSIFRKSVEKIQV